MFPTWSCSGICLHSLRTKEVKKIGEEQNILSNKHLLMLLSKRNRTGSKQINYLLQQINSSKGDLGTLWMVFLHQAWYSDILIGLSNKSHDLYIQNWRSEVDNLPMNREQMLPTSQSCFFKIKNPSAPGDLLKWSGDMEAIKWENLLIKDKVNSPRYSNTGSFTLQVSSRCLHWEFQRSDFTVEGQRWNLVYL